MNKGIPQHIAKTPVKAYATPVTPNHLDTFGPTVSAGKTEGLVIGAAQHKQVLDADAALEGVGIRSQLRILGRFVSISYWSVERDRGAIDGGHFHEIHEAAVNATSAITPVVTGSAIPGAHTCCRIGIASSVVISPFHIRVRCGQLVNLDDVPDVDV